MLTLLHLLSAVALLVWGTHIVRTGVMRVFGARLRTVLSSSVEKKPLAFCAGIGVTALVQSSNATTLLVTSFVAQDLVALAPALVIVLGADVGTALMARILTFDLSWLSGPNGRFPRACHSISSRCRAATIANTQAETQGGVDVTLIVGLFGCCLKKKRKRGGIS